MNIGKFMFSILLLRTYSSTLSQFFEKSWNSEEVIEETENVSILVDGDVVPSTLINEIHASHISVRLKFQNIYYVIDLTLNIHFVPTTYVDKIITENGTIYRNFNRSTDMCYYVGKVRSHSNSKAAFITCEGLKGFFVFDELMFHVKPLQFGSSALSQLYEIKMVADAGLSKWICGTKDFKKILKRNVNSRIKRQIISDSIEGQYVIELYVANDVSRLRYFENDVDKLSTNTKEIVNVASLLYQAVGFIVVLVGTEHWNSDQIDVNINSQKTLNNWQQYRFNSIVFQSYNDVGFLFSKQIFDGSVLGTSLPDSMCSSRRAVGVLRTKEDIPAFPGAALAHEIGHTLGLVHDTKDCQCESLDVPCIMSASSTPGKAFLYFSNCSKAQLKQSEKDYGICLQDLPLNQDSRYQICGNGILEQGEECDCGRRLYEECNAGCCDNITCKLIGQAKCSSGKCCDIISCQPKQAGYQCRSAIGPCDIAEVCDGNSAFCPKNIYKHDGVVVSYCWGGMCRSQRSRCNELFGPSVSESNPLCYQILNRYGNESGFCTFENDTFLACQPEDVMCGSLKCDVRDGSLTRYKNVIGDIKKNIGTLQCRSVLFDYGSRVENPGMVPNGAACGLEKMCVSQKCISVEIKLKEKPCLSCDSGVCTNEGKCICDPDTTCLGSGSSRSIKVSLSTSILLVMMSLIV